ncbi:Cyclin-dependent kinase inhibitor domain-containing protein [Dioscorea alata]|uniref:Cyclin-dependent kinase inhibitor domain-containing protein n=1 Tax=Dioscorea alata TaxID=55571 RepID=A0ACB7WT23_DIOAL|nr:Cyclin-dependent kinase inhibitor domain-containing protein [Dioscorea alata]
MGKYMKKGKPLSGEVALLGEPPLPPFIGVRTRSRTLALQRLQSSSPLSPSTPSSSYLQLRSRRLHKPKLASPKRGPKSSAKARPCSKSVPKEVPENDAGVEVSFGENVLDSETKNRNDRETTPCSLIKDSESAITPGSTTRKTNSAATNKRAQSSKPGHIPTACEIEEFFSGAEQLQQQAFAEKYNYDPVKDCPLPGRYEWVKLDS